MINIRSHPISIVVVFAISLHFVWSILLLIDPAATNATAVHALYRYIAPVNLLSAVVFVAAVLAAIGLYTRTPWITLLLLPQQILLMMSAAGALEAIYLGAFADGVERPRTFIAADQIYSILAALWHTVAIIAHARRVVQ